MPSTLTVVTEPMPKSQVGLTIEVPTEMVDATFDRVLNRLTSKAKVEGFRPGKAPRALVEARLGPGTIREQVVETMVPEVVRQAMAENSIDPIANPDVEVVELERGRPAKLKATVTVMPEVTLADPAGLAVTTDDLKVDDVMLERRLEDVRQPLAEITPVERETRRGDIAVIDVEVEADGQNVPSESRTAMEAELREGILLPELLTGLLGAFVGDERSVTVAFPESYSEPLLAGKEGTIKATVRGVKEKVLPPLDDALAKQLSDGMYETVDAYRDATRKDLEASAKAVSQLARQQAAAKALVDASSVEIPEALIQQEIASHLDSLERSLQRQGLRVDRYLEYLGKTPQQWIDDERPEAEEHVKADLVLNEFAKRENIAPTDDEVTTYIETQAAQDEELKGRAKELARNPTTRRYFTSRLRRVRALDRLSEVAGKSEPKET